MKIAIICDPIDIDQKTWISVYCEQLVKRLMLDRENEYVFYHTHENPFFDWVENVVVKNRGYWIFKSIHAAWKKFFLLPMEFRKKNIDLVHELNVIGSHIFDPFRKYKMIVTVFDLTPIVFAKYHTFLNVLGFKFFAWTSIKRSDSIISISNSTKADISKVYWIPESRISVTYLGSKINELEPVDRLGFKFPFILSVCTLEPRKNIRNLISSFAKLKEDTRFSNVKLILTGRIWWGMDELISELSLNDSSYKDIVLTGFIDDAQLAFLYKSCKIFAYPSLYEGFWLPVLEAMSLGAPVITSNLSSLPEVIWDSGILVNPYDVNDMSEKLSSLLLNEELRSKLSSEWIVRSKHFSWDKCFNETLEVYKRT